MNMTIYERMAAVFAMAGISGRLNEWRITEEEPELPDVFAVYQRTERSGDFYADDAPVVTRWELDIHVWGREDLSEAVDDLCQALREYEFDVLRATDIPDTAGSDYIYHTRIECARWE